MPFDVQGALAAGATPAQVADEMGKASGFNTSAARQSGATDEQIIHEMSSKQGSPTFGSAANDSFLNDFKSAAGTAMSDTGGLLQGAGSATGIQGLTDAGSYLRKNAPQPEAGYTGRGGEFMGDLKKGEYLRAGGDLLHGAASGSAESVAELGAGLGGGALGSFGGPAGAAAGAAAGAGLAGGAFALGRGGRLRAGQEAVTGSNLLDAAPAAAATGLVDAATMGRVPGGMLGRSVAMGAGGGANSAIGQYDTTGKVDPSQVVNDAASGAAMGALVEAPGVARRATSGAINNAMSRGYEPQSPEEAHSWVRVGKDLNTRAQDNPNSTPFQLSNSLKQDYGNRLEQLIRTAKEQGAEHDALNTMRTIRNQAYPHNNTLIDSTESAFGQLEGLEHGLTETQLREFKQTAMDSDTVSAQSLRNKATGPLQTAGKFVGTWGPAIADIPLGGGTGGLAAALLGHSITGKVGAAIGSAADRALGLDLPPVVLQSIAGKRALAKLGVDPQAREQGVAPPAPASEPVGPYGAPPAKVSTDTRLLQAQKAMAEQASQPNPAPGFVRPQITTPTPNPAPGFVRPQVEAPAPEGAPSSPYGTAGKAPPGGMALINQMKAKAQAEAEGIDPDTGNPRDPIPVNARIGATGKAARLAQATETQSAPLPALRPDSAATVAQALKEDPTMAAAVGAARTDSPGSFYLRKGLGLGSHEEAVALARQAEEAGVIPKGAADVIANPSSVPSHPNDLAAIKNFHRTSQGFTPPIDAQGAPIRSLPAYQAAHGEYHSTAQALAQQADAAVPGLGPAVLQVASTHGANRAATVALKTAEAHQLLAKLPPEQRAAASAYLLSDALLSHG